MPVRLLCVVLLLPLLTACAASSGSPLLAAPSPSPSASPSSTLPAGIDQVLTFVISGQTVDGPARPKITVNSTVQLVVTSDRADEIHLHGYDQMVDVPAGGTVTLTLTANIPGVFPMELEKEGFTITRLQVQ